MSNEELLDKLEKMDAEIDDTLERFGDDEDAYVGYLRKFCDNENIVLLRKAVDAGDSKTAENEVHTLKGLSANLGLLPLMDVCMDMLMDFRAGETDAAMAQIGTVEACFKQWADAIRG